MKLTNIPQRNNISNNLPQVDSINNSSSPISHSFNPSVIYRQQQQQLYGSNQQNSSIVTGVGSSNNLSPRLQAQNNSAIITSNYHHPYPSSSPLMRQIAQLQKNAAANHNNIQMLTQFPNIQVQKINQSQDQLVAGQKFITHNAMPQNDLHSSSSSSSNKKQMMMMNRLIQPRSQQQPQVTIVQTNKPSMALVDERSDEQTPLPPEYAQDDFQKDTGTDNQVNQQDSSFHLGLLHDQSLKQKYNSQPENSIFSRQKKFSKQKGLFKSRMNRTSPKSNSSNQKIFQRKDSTQYSRNNNSMILDSQSSIKLQSIKRKYENVRSKLQGYHDPKQSLKKIQELEKKIRQQQRVIQILNEDKALLEKDNQRNKQINKKLFEELTSAQNEGGDNHTLNFASISTNNDPLGSANSIIRGSVQSMNPQLQSISAPISDMKGNQYSQYYSNANPISLNGSSVLINSNNNHNLLKNSSNLPNIVNQQHQQQQSTLLKKPGSSVLGKPKN